MPRGPLRHVAVGAIVLVALAVTPAHADRCTAAKLGAVGKGEAGLLACQSRAAARGDASGVAACVATVDGRYGVAFANAGACSGDAATCKTVVAACAAVIRSDLPDAGPNRCTAMRLRVAGKLAAAKLLCNAKATSWLSVDAACIEKADGKFRAAFAKTAGCPGDRAAIEDAVDRHCVEAAGADARGGGTAGALCDGATTTTTTSTLPCGYTDATQLACGGACPAGETCVGEVTIADPPIATCACVTASRCLAGSCTIFPIDCAGGACADDCGDGGEHGCPAGYACDVDRFLCAGPGCAADCSCPAAGRCTF